MGVCHRSISNQFLRFVACAAQCLFLRNGEVSTRVEARRVGLSLHARYRMQKIIALFGLVLLSAGCASMGTMSTTLSELNPNTSSLEIHNQTDVKLTEGNFEVVKTNVVGQARGFALLGFINIVPARFQTAMDRLYVKASMETGKPQTLGNLIVEKTSAYWILFSIPRVSVRADVVEFTPDAATIILPRPRPDLSPPPEGMKPDTGGSKGL